MPGGHTTTERKPRLIRALIGRSRVPVAARDQPHRNRISVFGRKPMSELASRWQAGPLNTAPATPRNGVHAFDYLQHGSNTPPGMEDCLNLEAHREVRQP